MVTRTRSELTPNDWVTYVDAHSGELMHIDEFYNPHRAVPRYAPAELIAGAVWETPEDEARAKRDGRP